MEPTGIVGGAKNGGPAGRRSAVTGVSVTVGAPAVFKWIVVGFEVAKRRVSESQVTVGGGRATPATRTSLVDRVMPGVSEST